MRIWKVVVSFGCLAVGVGMASCAVGCAKVRNPIPGVRSDSVRAGDGSEWPELPGSPEAAKELVAARTWRGPGGNRPSLVPDEIARLLFESVAEDRLTVGWQAIVAFFQARFDRALTSGRDAFLLIGSWHDAPIQVEAFRRLIGPFGLSGITAAVVEQFDADGRWQGLGDLVQDGDDRDLGLYLASGSPGAWERLVQNQVAQNYTAFRYGYLEQIMDLLVTARAVGVPLVGCDMPPALQVAAVGSGQEHLDRLRELHCLLALLRVQKKTVGPARVAMFWGQAHLRENGFQRFLPRSAEVIRVSLFGGRAGSHGPGRELGQRLSITGPVLFEVDGLRGEYALLLPGRRLAAQVERKRTRDAELVAAQRGRLSVRSQRPGSLQLPTLEVAIHEQDRHLTLAPGRIPFVFRHTDGSMVGAVSMPSDGGLELVFDPQRRAVEWTLFDGSQQDLCE